MLTLSMMIDLLGFRSLIYLFCLLLLKYFFCFLLDDLNFFFTILFSLFCWISRCPPVWFVCSLVMASGVTVPSVLGANIAQCTPNVEPFNLRGPFSAIVACVTATSSKDVMIQRHSCCFIPTCGF